MEFYICWKSWAAGWRTTRAILEDQGTINEDMDGFRMNSEYVVENEHEGKYEEYVINDRIDDVNDEQL